MSRTQTTIIVEPERKDSIYKLALEYTWIAEFCKAPLHQVVGARLGKVILLREHNRCPRTKGISGAAELHDGTTLIQINTAPAEIAGPLVIQWVRAHETGHIVLEHYEQGMLLFGSASEPLEQESSIFALAHIVACGVADTNVLAVAKEVFAGEPIGKPFAPEDALRREIGRIRGMWKALADRTGQVSLL